MQLRHLATLAYFSALDPPVPRLRTRCSVPHALLDDAPVTVDIAAPGMNSRTITASIVVDTGVDEVWSILTDYDNLATHVPNLVVSETRPAPPGQTRLYQEGAQKIIGFEFSAALEMDMREVIDEAQPSTRQIKFSLVESVMFASFDGEWRVQPYSRRRMRDDPSPYAYKTKLIYKVTITPRGLVPIPAIEWRIREDVPSNLRGVKQAAERLAASEVSRREAR